MAREYFCAYHSMIKPLQKISDAERGRLFMALLQHSAGETPINLQGREEIAFEIYADQIDRDREAYEARCETNRKNGANGTERPRTVPNAPQEKEHSCNTGSIGAELCLSVQGNVDDANPHHRMGCRRGVQEPPRRRQRHQGYPD